MPHRQNPAELPSNAEIMVASNAMVGVSGSDLLGSLRQIAFHGLRQPLHTLKHLGQLGKSLGHVVLGDSAIAPNKTDLRFNDPTWQFNPLYRRTMQSYLAVQQQLHSWLKESDLPGEDKARALFVMGLLTDAASPSNALINPQAVKELFDTAGYSVVKGLRNLFDDWLHNGGLPSQVSKHAFEVGKNLATSEGAVVYRSDMFELIQYKPLTEQVYAKPLLIVPPQINKFYIFDLSPEKSFVRYCLKHGLQTFIISWRNPDARHREWGLSSYAEAVQQAMQVMQQICGSKDVHLLGACAGGMNIALLQGHLAAKRKLKQVASATYLVSLLDCQIDSQMTLFANEETIETAKRRSYQQGVLDGRDMARVFAWLRPNDLIWNYWVNNYLLGKEPPAFDVLYWNNDNTRLPATLHGDLLDCFKYNPLARANAIEVCGTPIDLKKVTVDSMTIGGMTDHITPWDAVYRSANLLGGDSRFILSSSGHVQSILNPPEKRSKRYFYQSGALSSDPRAWLYDAKRQEGSWWPTWLNWMQERSGEKQEAVPALGNQSHPVLGDAPGIFVHVR